MLHQSMFIDLANEYSYVALLWIYHERKLLRYISYLITVLKLRILCQIKNLHSLTSWFCSTSQWLKKKTYALAGTWNQMSTLNSVFFSYLHFFQFYESFIRIKTECFHCCVPLHKSIKHCRVSDYCKPPRGPILLLYRILI